MEVFVFLITVCMTLSLLAIGFASVALIKILSFEKSTHKIQYMPVQKEGGISEKEMKDVLDDFGHVSDFT